MPEAGGEEERETGETGKRGRLGKRQNEETGADAGQGRRSEDWRQKPEEESPVWAWALCYLCELLFKDRGMPRHGRKTRYLLLQR